MNHRVPESLIIIAGKGAYPRLLAESARRQGVKKIVAMAFRKETDRRIERFADHTTWLYMGQFGHLLEALAKTGIPQCVMAGQITPSNLFRARFDAKGLALLNSLRKRNADTIFSTVGKELKELGIDLLSASSFMESHMPKEGILTEREPSEIEQRDISQGLVVARTTSSLEIGQTVVIKQGTVLAVEAFEGTDQTIKRAGRLGGPGAVVVKVAKQGHDMRFDIPVIGMHTMKIAAKAKIGVVAVEAGRAILLERERVITEANRIGLCIVALGHSTPAVKERE